MWVDFHKNFRGAETKFLKDTWTKWVNQDIGVFDKAKKEVFASGRLQVDPD
jgi:hypothetical protein